MTPKQTQYHAVQFYKDAESLASTVARFLTEGFKVGEPAIIIATPLHSAAIIDELSACGLNGQDLLRTGELQVFDARKLLAAFMIKGTPDPLLFKSNIGELIERLCDGRTPSPVRAYGEMVDLLWQEGNADGAIRLELLWNHLASAYDFSMLCGYAVGHFYKETERFQEICDQHSNVVSA